MLRTPNIRNGRIDTENCFYVDEETFSKWTRRATLQVGDTILTREAPVGEVGLVREAEGFFLGQRLMQYRADPSVMDGIFLHFAMRSPHLSAQFHAHGGTGSVVDHLRVPDCKEFKVPCPPLPQQRAIAATLGALDDKIELNRRMSATLEEMARALYRSWFVDFDPVHAKAQGRVPAHMDPTTAALFPDRFGEDGLPEGWEVKKIKELCEIKGGKQLTKERFADDGAYPVFGGAGQMGMTNEWNADGFVITVGRVGAYCGNFFAHRGKSWVNNNASLITPFDDTPSEFVFLSLQALDLSSIKKGAAQPFISNGDLKELGTVVSTKPILAAFNRQAKLLRLRIEALQYENQTLAQLRDTLLPKLMSGELRIREAEKQIEEVV